MREATSLLITACAGNLLLVLAFMLRVDWQPQGRYLLPSLAPLAAFGALAVGRLPERWRKVALVVLPAFSVAVAAYAAFFIAAVYGS
jgi:peptidoglycan/LPS O-acetylase OafA/YrhL